MTLAGFALVAVVSLAVAVVAGTAPLTAAVAVALMMPAAAIDVRDLRIPDVWVLAASAWLIAAPSFDTAFGSSAGPAAPIAGVLGGALAMAVPVLLLHLVSPDAMGFGDVKAALVLGAAAGMIDWRLGAVALCIAALTGATTGVLLRRRTIPFGPFLVFGAWIVVLAGDTTVDALFTGASPR